jgi:hypothetical protein
MHELHLSEVQYLNLHALCVLSSMLAGNPVGACATFGVHRDRLEPLRPLLTPQRILATVSSGRDDSLVRLREDAHTLLSAPSGLIAVLSSAHPLGLADSAATPEA